MLRRLTPLLAMIGFLVPGALRPVSAQSVAQVTPSTELDQYFRTLRIAGRADSRALSVRSAFTGRWRIERRHPWEPHIQQNSPITYGLSQFVSWNSALPHGGNDGALWQGRGANLRTAGGVSIEQGLFSLRFFPEVTYSQNRAYELLESASRFPSGNYRASPDAPQRFGSDTRLDVDLGDSEVRLTWRDFTVGVGTSATSIGPGWDFSIMHSTNAPSYPRIDVGILPVQTDWGEVEARVWSGITQPSGYGAENDPTSLSFLSTSFSPSIVPGLTVGFHRSALRNATEGVFPGMAVLFNPIQSMQYAGDGIDQRASISVEWILPTSGFSLFGEFAKNDFSTSLRTILREPEHSAAYSLGFAQVIAATPTRLVRMAAEHVQSAWSRDYLLGLGMGGTFYGHGSVKQGYTNKGQWIGLYTGSGSNAQRFSVDFYEQWGRLGFYLKRSARDTDRLYGNPDNYFTEPDGDKDILRIDVEATVGVSGTWWRHGLPLSLELAWVYNINRNWIEGNDISGVHIAFSTRYSF